MDFIRGSFQLFAQKARIDGASSNTSPPKISSSLFMLYEPAPPRITTIDIIFFHGLLFEQNSDAYLSTWRSGDAKQEVWPEKWLPVKYPGARMIFVSYDAFIGTTGTEEVITLHGYIIETKSRR